MKRTLITIAAAACAVMAVSGVSLADSISSVENARAKDRAGDYLNREDREHLRKYGRTSEAGFGDAGIGGYYASDNDDRDDDDNDDPADAAGYAGSDRYVDRY